MRKTWDKSGSPQKAVMKNNDMFNAENDEENLDQSKNLNKSKQFKIEMAREMEKV